MGAHLLRTHTWGVKGQCWGNCVRSVGLGPLARARADVSRGGANQAAGLLLLEIMSAPPGDPAYREGRREGRAGQADRIEQNGSVELDVGAKGAFRVAFLQK